MPLSAEKVANFRSFQAEIAAPRADGATSNAPLLLVIEPTSRCNFKCVHCSQTFNKQAPASMSLALFQGMLPALPTALELYLFGDGEALLDIPRHLAMIARIHREDPACSLGFSTNGKLLTPEVYELYAAAGIGYIQISIDAAEKELYEDMRRGGSFDELVANLEGIAALRRHSPFKQPSLHLAAVISRQNYRQLPALAEFAERYGFSLLYVNAEYPHNPGRDRLRLTADDLPELERIRAALAPRPGSGLRIVFDPCLGLQPTVRQRCFEPKSPVYCTVPWQRFELKANGDVKICPYYCEPVCSMNGRSLQEIWNGPEFRGVRRAFASGSGIPPYCTGCQLGMRKQYLSGYPGISHMRRFALLARMISARYWSL